MGLFLAAFLSAGLIVLSVHELATGRFPAWMSGRLLWPLRRLDPPVARLQGASALALAPALPLVAASEAVGPAGLAAGLAACGLGVALALYSIRLSWRPVPAEERTV